MEIIDTHIANKKIDFDLFRYALKDCKVTTLHDAACGEGLYSIIAHGLGYKVTASDARDIRVPFDEFKTHNITFRKGIIEDIDFTEDVILLSGILYHLDISQQLILLENIVKTNFKRIILNTHFYNDSCEIGFPNLFHEVKRGCYTGAVYKEGARLSGRSMAAFHNYYSFWHDLESLERLFNYFDLKITMLKPLLTDNRGFFIVEK